MRRGLLAGSVLLVLLLGALVVATAWLSAPKLGAPLRGIPSHALEIAPVAEALTFARVDRDGRTRVALVTSADADGVAFLDVEAASGRRLRDGIEAYAVLGYDALERMAGGATARAPLADLSIPFDAPGPHVAAGTNFRAHAEEVGRDEGPFLFPKLSEPTRWDADVPDRARLDYEAEICAVTLSTRAPGDPTRLGYLLCNDFTDRWTLARQIDLDGPMGITGFADAKGGPGMLPVGPLLVIPRAPDAFHRDLVLELAVDGALRQRAPGRQMIWSPSEIVSRALERCDDVYLREAGSVELTDCAGIPPRTLILTGTPGGVLFHPLTLWSKRAYLEPGDEVLTAATHLGVLRNRIR